MVRSDIPGVIFFALEPESVLGISLYDGLNVFQCPIGGLSIGAFLLSKVLKHIFDGDVAVVADRNLRFCRAVSEKPRHCFG